MGGLYQNNAEWQVISETHAGCHLERIPQAREKWKKSGEANESYATGLKAWPRPGNVSGLRCSLDFAQNDVYMRYLMPDDSLLCPRCKVPSKKLRTSGGVLSGCDFCAGRAVTIELLRKRFTPKSINPRWQHALQNRCHYILRAEFFADAPRFFDALRSRLVSLNSIASLVRFRSLDFVPDHRHF